MKELVGKFVIRSGRENWRTGQITTANDTAVLIKFDNMKSGDASPWRFPSELICIDELMHAHEDDMRVWGFFDTREELNAFIAWLDAPDESDGPRIVRITPKGKQ